MLSWQRFLLHFVGFWLLTMLLYRHGFGSQFTDDFIAGIVKFMDEGWSGYADSFDFTSLYYGHNIVFYGFYSLFGSSPLAWFLLFTGLHSLNATLAFGFLKRLFTNHGFSAGNGGAIVCALLFLVGPYQTENVIWGATLHYAVSMLCMWGFVWLYASYLNTGNAWKLGAGYIIFAFSLLTLEITLVFPGIFMLIFGWLWQPTRSWEMFRKSFLTIALPMGLIMVLYIGATYFLKGHYIGHYGDSHLQFEITQVIGTFWQYMAKLLGFAHFLPWKEKIYTLLVDARVALGLLLLAIGAWAVLFKYRRPLAWFSLGWVGLIFVTLLPVLNMYFMYLNQGENDRLSYFASIFVYSVPVLLLMWFAKRWVWVFGAVAMVVFIVLLLPHTVKWQRATQVQNLAVDSPHFYGTTGNLYLLNLPVYFNGIYVYRNINRLHWARKYYQLPDVSAQTVYVLSANMHNLTDSVSVVPLPEANTFKIELSAWGNWFWHHILGAQSRKEESMTVTVDEWNHSYILQVPNLKPEDRLLYFGPNGWQPVNQNPPPHGY